MVYRCWGLSLLAARAMPRVALTHRWRFPTLCPPMNQSLRQALAGCMSVVALAAAPAAGEGPSLKPRQGVVLLNNGELIAGSIIDAGDRYDVHLASGEISVKRRDVAMVCRDAQECYRQKLSSIDPDSAQD